MKSFAEILSNELMDAIGWTLLHSLWQSLIVLVLVVGCLRMIPSMRSSARYVVACSGLILFVCLSFVTFLIEYGPPSISPTQQIAFPPSLILQTSSPQESQPAILATLINTIQMSIPVIVGLWAIGFLFFSARLASGYIYSRTLTDSSVTIHHHWKSLIKNACTKLQINRFVSLAESAIIHSPIVVGYFKPVILIPVGMISGLTTEQVETIIWHELAHIRRHDYLVNLMQSVVETIFFFNPCVRILSNEIRREREYCCDDLVIQHHGGSHAYALALTHLAEVKLAQTGFALALADNNNHLFKRIRRIMERSTSQGNAKGKFIVPLIVLFTALLCISWLGTGKERTENNLKQGLNNDTIPGDKSNTARYSRKSIITFNEKGEPHEEIVEEFEGDERLRPLLQPHKPSLRGTLTPAVPPQMLDPMSPLSVDTIPPMPFSFDDMKEWEEFSNSFQEAFKGQFEKFYGLQPADSLFFGFRDGFAYPDTEAFKEFEQQMEQFNSEHFQDFGDHFNFQPEQMGGYETKLRDELIKDGYLSEDETINSLEWNNDSFKVNGNAISPKHEKKYRELNDEFFGRMEHRSRQGRIAQ